MEGFVMSATMILMCALELLGRFGATLPPIELVLATPSGVAANVEAFVRAGSGVISLLTSSDVFAAAARNGCQDAGAVAKIASIIAHEEWHVLHGADERGAYDAQLATLVRLGVSPGSTLFQGVLRSRQAVIESQRIRR
jgi:hypothetical protein